MRACIDTRRAQYLPPTIRSYDFPLANSILNHLRVARKPFAEELLHGPRILLPLSRHAIKVNVDVLLWFISLSDVVEVHQSRCFLCWYRHKAKVYLCSCIDCM